MAITYEVAEVRNVNAAETVYTVPAGKTAIITAAIADNSDASAQVFSNINFSGNIYWRNISIPVGGKILNEIEGQMLEESTSIGVSATGSFLSIRINLKVIDNV